MPSVLECGDEKFSCGTSGECTYKAWLCDGEEDCENGADENKTNCGKVINAVAIFLITGSI